MLTLTHKQARRVQTTAKYSLLALSVILGTLYTLAVLVTVLCEMAIDTAMDAHQHLENLPQSAVPELVAVVDAAEPATVDAAELVAVVDAAEPATVDAVDAAEPATVDAAEPAVLPYASSRHLTRMPLAELRAVLKDAGYPIQSDNGKWIKRAVLVSTYRKGAESRPTT